jgi:ABC-type branched-subunit amino acid transport system substrate-binding protein
MVRPVAVLALALLVACGARWTDAQRASVAARYARVASAGARDAASGGPAIVDNSNPEPSGVAQERGAGAAASAAPGPARALTAPCAAPSNAPGVTASEIDVAAISALSGPVPGLAASAAGAARAYVGYRNSTGGVCGRKIVLHQVDDGTDGARYRSIVSELGPHVFGIAGGFTIGDAGGRDVVAAQRLPVVNGPSTQAVADLPTVFDIFPRYENPHAVIGKYRWLRAHGATKVAIAYLSVDASRLEAELQQGLMEAAGIKTVLVRALPLSTLSYDSTARAVANSGADYLWFIADINGEASMARSMADTGYKLNFAEYYNFPYGTRFTDLAGRAAEGTVAFLRSLPNEEAATNRELSTFVEWMDRIAPGEDLDPFAVDSWVSAKVFFDTLQALPGPITRDSFLAALKAIKIYDAGGMFGPIRFGAELTNACVIGMRYQGGAWHRFVPDSGFLC